MQDGQLGYQIVVFDEDEAAVVDVIFCEVHGLAEGWILDVEGCFVEKVEF